MGTATWSVMTNPSAVAVGTTTYLSVILAVASSTIREGRLVHFILKFWRHTRRSPPKPCAL